MANLTPFRYPGAKNKFLSYLTPYINNKKPFADLFVGGGSVLLHIAENNPSLPLMANDKDENIYSFWKLVVEGQLDDLFNLIDTKPTIELFNKLRETKPSSVIDKAYHAIFFNRTCFSGIAMAGPIGGVSQDKNKIDCRYNAEKLKTKIIKCHELLKNRTIVKNENAVNLLSNDFFMYCDPPYILAGDSLYPQKMSVAEHYIFAEEIQKYEDWLLSYDNTETIRELYKNNKIINIKAQYCISSKEWKDKCELIIMK